MNGAEFTIRCSIAGLLVFRPYYKYLAVNFRSRCTQGVAAMRLAIGLEGWKIIAGAVLLAAAVIFVIAPTARADEPPNPPTKFALVIGNGAYQNVPELPNPPHDAGDVAAAFRRLGFSVRLVTNATYDDMRRALLDFSQKARNSDMAVVYFAGHGMEVGGENWLIPIDAELKTDLDTEQEAISLRAIMLMVSTASKLGLVVLDACRNNPFLAKMKRTIATRGISRGLSSIEPTNNVLVAYAAKDGTTAADGNGRNSPFTSAFLKYVETPGLEVTFLFRDVRDDVIAATHSEQQPFVYGSLSREAIYLKPPPVVPPPVGADETTWTLLKETTDEAALKRFTAQYPTSPLRRDADARIAALEAAQAAKLVPPSADEVTWTLLKETTDEAALNRFIAQYPNSPLRKDADARIAALEAAQAAKPVPPSADEVTWTLLKETTDEAALKRFTAQYPNSPLRKDAEARIAALEAAQAAKPVPPSSDEVTWMLLKETTDEAALKRFTAQYPNSPLRKDAEARIAALDAAQAAQPVPPSPDEVTWLLLKDTTDEAALKRFATQYPNSPLRKDAEARIATLEAAQAAKPVPPAPDQIAWSMVKDSKDPDQLRRFVEQFPNSAQRADAEQRIASLAAEEQKLASLTDPHDLARLLQFELKRVGCFNGAVTGEFDDPTKAAWHNFTKLTAAKLPDDVSPDAIKAVRGVDGRVCPLACPSGEHAQGEICVANAPTPKRAEVEPSRPAPAPRPPAAAAAPRGNGKCFSFQGRQFCE
jgi:outer membrane protein assembly factor BamD (BamD/ComL family)